MNHMSVPHLRRCLAEFSGRHNSRNEDTAARMRCLAQGLVGQLLTWEMRAYRTGQAAALAGLHSQPSGVRGIRLGKTVLPNCKCGPFNRLWSETNPAPIPPSGTTARCAHRVRPAQIGTLGTHVCSSRS